MTAVRNLQGCLFSTASAQEAPFGWLMDRQRGMVESIMHLLSTCASIEIVIYMLSRQLDKLPSEPGISYVITSATVLMSLVTVGRRFMPDLSQNQFHRCVVAFMLVFSSVLVYLSAFTADKILRARAGVVAVFALQPILLSLGLPMRSYIMISLWSFTHFIIATRVAQELYDDEYPLRYYATATLFHFLCCSMARHQHRCMKQLYDAQEHLQAERNASKLLVAQLRAEQSALANLLSMVCDASIWFASDGDTVMRSEPRFDEIAGHDTLNHRFSSMLPRREQDRFKAAMLQESVIPPAIPVRLLTTSLLRSSTNREIDVELFIVERRRDSSEAGQLLHLPRYLVGVRLMVPLDPDPIAHPAEQILSVLHPLSDDSAAVSQAVKGSERYSLQHEPAPGRKQNRHVTFSEVESIQSDTASSNSNARSILRKEKSFSTAEPFNGPLHGPPFVASGQYLRECSRSILEDLISSWNFPVRGCCSWHANVQYLQRMAYEMGRDRNCGDDWVPANVWQCKSCDAVVGEDHPSDACWICCESNVGE